MVVFRPNVYLGINQQSFKGKKVEVGYDMPKIYEELRDGTYTSSDLLAAIKKERKQKPSENRKTFLNKLEEVVKEQF